MNFTNEPKYLRRFKKRKKTSFIKESETFPEEKRTPPA